MKESFIPSCEAGGGGGGGAPQRHLLTSRHWKELILKHITHNENLRSNIQRDQWSLIHKQLTLENKFFWIKRF